MIFNAQSSCEIMTESDTMLRMTILGAGVGVRIGSGVKGQEIIA